MSDVVYPSRCWCSHLFIVVYYESIKSELQTRPIYECRGDERLKTKDEESIRLGYTGFLGELEHLKIKTMLIAEMNVVYYESIKRELKIRPMYKCRCVDCLRV